MITYQEYQKVGALNSAGGAQVARSIVDRMADKMLEMGMNGIAVTADSMHEHSDFTRAEIAIHGPEASDLARSLAVTRLD
jgi:Zn-dependent membrane protease YugP